MHRDPLHFIISGYPSHDVRIVFAPAVLKGLCRFLAWPQLRR
jgi:hypothetical protein